ncbi:MAG: hypothetical protein ACK2VA_07275, partial [Anaerolineae bacterium]
EIAQDQVAPIAGDAQDPPATPTPAAPAAYACSVEPSPETIIYADETGIDVETYIQIYNAAGFLMQVEADWIMRVINNAQKPVMTIKPLAAGKLLPVVGLAFVWSTIRDQDMVTIGTTTPAEAREAIEISLQLLERRVPDNELQRTRSKQSLE